MENYFDYTFEVGSADIDIWGYLKPTTLLAVCQDVAYKHSTAKGLGFEVLVAQNLAWVLSRIKVLIERMPAWHEEIRVRTWHKRQSGLFSLRDYIFYDADDVPIIKITSSWLIINLATRRITRIDKVFSQDDSLSLAQYEVDAIEAEAERVEVSADKCFAGEHRVLYSDVDINKHVNNTKYVEWACDYSEPQMQESMRLKSLCVNFNHEAKYNDVVALSLSHTSPTKLTIEGEISQRSVFAVALEYEAK